MAAESSLRDRFERGLDAPICLTWELTWACNLACVHCLSSSGRRDPDELTTAEAAALIDAFASLQVFYVNVGGGEPTIRGDFFELLEHAVAKKVGVKFSTNGTRLDAARARRIASMDYVDVQISIDGADAPTNDAVRGRGSFDAAVRAMRALADAGMQGFKVSVRSAEPRAVPLAHRPPGHLDGRLVLPSLRARSAARRAEPLRRRPRRLPRRPDRRRLCVPLRDP